MHTVVPMKMSMRSGTRRNRLGRFRGLKRGPWVTQSREYSNKYWYIYLNGVIRLWQIPCIQVLRVPKRKCSRLSIQLLSSLEKCTSFPGLNYRNQRRKIIRFHTDRTIKCLFETIIIIDALSVDHESNLDAWLEGHGLLHLTIHSQNSLRYPFVQLIKNKATS